MKALLLIAVAAQAQVADLTIERAVELAKRNHPDIVAAKAALPVADARISAANALPSPLVRFNTTRIGFDPDLADSRSNLGLQWSPPRPGEIAWKRRVAEARKAGSEAEIREVESRVAVEVRLAHRAAALSGQRSSVASEAVELRKRMLEVVRRQVAAGLKEAGETDLAELAVADAESEARQAAASAAKDQRVLARLTGLEPGGFRVEGDQSRLAFDREAVTRAAGERPDIARQRAACRQFAVEESAARNQRFPWLGSVQVMRRLDNVALGAWAVQASVELPYFRPQWRAQARIVGAERSQCESAANAMAARARREAEEALDGIDPIVRELENLERLRTGVAQTALERARKSVAEGRGDLLDILNAEARQVSLRGRWLERGMELARLRARLELLSGVI